MGSVADRYDYRRSGKRGKPVTFSMKVQSMRVSAISRVPSRTCASVKAVRASSQSNVPSMAAAGFSCRMVRKPLCGPPEAFGGFSGHVINSDGSSSSGLWPDAYPRMVRGEDEGVTAEDIVGSFRFISNLNGDLENSVMRGALIRAMAREAPSMDAEQISYCLLSMAVLRADPYEATEPLCAGVRKHIDSMNSEQVVRVLLGIALLGGVIDLDDMKAPVTAAIVRELPSMYTGELAATMGALATMRRNFGVQFEDAHEPLAAAVAREAKDMTGHHVQMVIRAFDDLGINPGEAREPLQATLHRTVNDLPAEYLKGLPFVCNRLQIEFKQPTGPVLTKAEKARPEMIARTASFLTGLGMDPSDAQAEMKAIFDAPDASDASSSASSKGTPSSKE